MRSRMKWSIILSVSLSCLHRLAILTIIIGHYGPVATTPQVYTHLQIPRSMAQVRIEEPLQRPTTRAPKPPSISIPPPADFLPATSSGSTSYSAQVTAIPSLDDKERKSPTGHRRTRSMTTPPVSGSPVNVSYIHPLHELIKIKMYVDEFAGGCSCFPQSLLGCSDFIGHDQSTSPMP